MAFLTQNRSYRTFKVINYFAKKYILMKVSLKYGSSKIRKKGLISKYLKMQVRLWR